MCILCDDFFSVILLHWCCGMAVNLHCKKMIIKNSNEQISYVFFKYKNLVPSIMSLWNCTQFMSIFFGHLRCSVSSISLFTLMPYLIHTFWTYFLIHSLQMGQFQPFNVCRSFQRKSDFSNNGQKMLCDPTYWTLSVHWIQRHKKFSTHKGILFILKNSWLSRKLQHVTWVHKYINHPLCRCMFVMQFFHGNNIFFLNIEAPTKYKEIPGRAR